MKLKNKNTGEVVEIQIRPVVYGKGGDFVGPVLETIFGKKLSLETLCEYCEDYKEPADKIENIWTGNRRDKTVHIKCNSEEYAKEVLSKLKAWKRLEDYGVRFCSWFYDIEKQEIKIKAEFKEFEEVIVGQNRKDLDLLFGGNQ